LLELLEIGFARDVPFFSGSVEGLSFICADGSR
jgi:hypothetical protein